MRDNIDAVLHNDHHDTWRPSRPVPPTTMTTTTSVPLPLHGTTNTRTDTTTTRAWSNRRRLTPAAPTTTPITSRGLQTIASEIQSRIQLRKEEAALLRRARDELDRDETQRQATLRDYDEIRTRYVQQRQERLDQEANRRQQRLAFVRRHQSIDQLRHRTEQLQQQLDRQQQQWDTRVLPHVAQHRLVRALFQRQLSRSLTTHERRRHVSDARQKWLQQTLVDLDEQLQWLRSQGLESVHQALEHAMQKEQAVNQQVQLYASQVRETLTRRSELRRKLREARHPNP